METLLHRLAINAGAEHRQDREEPRRTYSIVTPPPPTRQHRSDTKP
jgi:hypothetical protein